MRREKKGKTGGVVHLAIEARSRQASCFFQDQLEVMARFGGFALGETGNLGKSRLAPPLAASPVSLHSSAFSTNPNSAARPLQPIPRDESTPSCRAGRAGFRSAAGKHEILTGGPRPLCSLGLQKETHPMAWSKWRGALALGALASVGLVWSQSPMFHGQKASPQPIRGERILTVHEDGKPLRCRVVQTWRHPVGRPGPPTASHRYGRNPDHRRGRSADHGADADRQVGEGAADAHLPLGPAEPGAPEARPCRRA